MNAAARIADNRTAGTNKHPVIFCDFDGTITLNDNIVELFKHFKPPGAEAIMRELAAGTKTLRQGVGELFALFPSRRKSELEQYVLQTAAIRPGFRDLLDFCRMRDIAFYVTSGGIDFIVHPLLAPFPIERDRIFCNSASFDGPQIRIEWPHPCDADCDNDCGMCKTRVIRRFPEERFFRLLIGDSLTDFAGARIADHVFARSHLLQRCRQLEIPHTPYETFYEVIDKLEEMFPGGRT